jgi:DNA-binding transcriptional MerR regulator
MLDQEGKYNIKAVSKMVGIQPGTLRAWERRYQMIAPVRNELGYRLYTEEHVKILKWLIKKVNKGFTIGQAVSLLDNQNINLEQEKITEGTGVSSLLDDLLDTLLSFNELKAQGIINTMFSVFTIEKVIFEIFCSLLIKTEELREARKINSAEEQFIIAFIRSRINSIFHSLPQNEFLPKAILACCPGEYHELGLLMFSLFLRRKGLEVIYLGTGVLEEDLEEVVKKIRPNYLFLSCSLQENLTLLLSMVTQLSLNYKHLMIGIGGRAVDLMKKSEKDQFSSLIVGPSLPQWEKWLPNISPIT